MTDTATVAPTAPSPEAKTMDATPTVTVPVVDELTALKAENAQLRAALFQSQQELGLWKPLATVQSRVIGALKLVDAPS